MMCSRMLERIFSSGSRSKKRHSDDEDFGKGRIVDQDGVFRS